MHDPGWVVFDEAAGIFLALAMVPQWLVHDLPIVVCLLAFTLFRLFDILLKPWPIAALDRLPGALGVMLDDLGAGVIAGIITGNVVRFKTGIREKEFMVSRRTQVARKERGGRQGVGAVRRRVLPALQPEQLPKGTATFWPFFAAARSGERTASSDHRATVSGGRGGGGRVQRKGFVSLRGKLMVMMAGITALAMVLMGTFLAKTSADFVLGTSMHKGGNRQDHRRPGAGSIG